MNILGLGLPEIIIIALVLLLFFGQKRLPGLFRSLGSSISELKRGLQDDGAVNPTDSPSETTRSQSDNDATSKTTEVDTKKDTTPS